MENFNRGLGLFAGGLALVLFFAAFLALPVMWLWNGCLVDVVDGIHPIGFWQALGLNILFRILFKTTSSSSNK